MNGITLAMLAAFCWAIEAILVRRGSLGFDPLLGTAVANIAAGVVFLVYLITTRNFTTIFDRGVIYFVLAGIVSFVIGHAFYYLSINQINISKSVPIAASYPFIAAIFSFIIFREPLSLRSIIGIVLIWLGTILLV